jgi:hypothetical protein
MALELHDIKNTPNESNHPCLFNSPVNITYPVSADKAMGKEMRTLPNSNIIFKYDFKIDRFVLFFVLFH